MFESVNNNVSITLDEFQEQYEFVSIKVYQGESIINVQLDRYEFDQLCNMKYRLEFPAQLQESSQELSLVA